MKKMLLKRVLIWAMAFAAQPLILTAQGDPHSFVDSSSARAEHYQIDLTVDFERRTIAGKTLAFIRNGNTQKRIILDTWGLTIESVTLISKTGRRRPAIFLLGVPNEEGFVAAGFDPVKGQCLSIELDNDVTQVEIKHRSASEPSGTMWLASHQTFGGAHPMLVSSSEPIGARGMLPIQDGPSYKFTYEATIRLSSNALLPLMSAEDNPKVKNTEGIYRFKMSRSIPAYLFSLCIGNFDYRPIGPNSGCYAEPEQLARAAVEFSEFEAIVHAAEKTMDANPWASRNDLLVISSKAFSYTAMENPHIILCSSYMVTGDKSQLYVLAHELAHVAFTNIISHLTWSDLPICNEGLTEYLRYQIVKKAFGKELADAQFYLDYIDMVQQIPANPGFILRPAQLENPDHIFHKLSYEKGAFFWHDVERQLGGAEALLARLRELKKARPFGSISTQEMLSFVMNKPVHLDDRPWPAIWLNEASLPPFSMEEPLVLQQIREKYERYKQDGTVPPVPELKTWTVPQWQYFFYLLQTDEDISQTNARSLLDAVVKGMNLSNLTLKSKLLQGFVQFGRAQAMETELDAFLGAHSTLRLLTGIYGELSKTAEGKAIAYRIYNKHKNNYYKTTRQAIADILDIIIQ